MCLCVLCWKACPNVNQAAWNPCPLTRELGGHRRGGRCPLPRPRESSLLKRHHFPVHVCSAIISGDILFRGISSVGPPNWILSDTFRSRKAVLHRATRQPPPARTYVTVRGGQVHTRPSSAPSSLPAPAPWRLSEPQSEPWGTTVGDPLY